MLKEVDNTRYVRHLLTNWYGGIDDDDIGDDEDDNSEQHQVCQTPGDQDDGDGGGDNHGDHDLD